MSTRRPPQTFVDYLIVAISPALIISMVVSLGWFVIAVAGGPMAWRASWICFFFTLAAVLITRIALEMGSNQAWAYGGLLALATVAVLLRFSPATIWLTIPLLAAIWWCVHKLTWDSTMVDDGARAPTEGLLETMGLDRTPVRSPQGTEPGTADPATAGVTGVGTLGWWQRLVAAGGRMHRPGIWVVYFALAAIPIFGLGQALVPREDLALRRRTFLLLCSYVASALALLMSTSLLQLRRYLRQRHVAMPDAMARTWLLTGLALIAGVMLLCQLLPRPAREYAVFESAILRIDRKLRSSRWGIGPDGTAGDAPGPASRSIDGASARRSSPGRSTRPGAPPQPGAPSPPGADSPPGAASSSGDAPSPDAARRGAANEPDGTPQPRGHSAGEAHGSASRPPGASQPVQPDASSDPSSDSSPPQAGRDPSDPSRSGSGSGASAPRSGEGSQAARGGADDRGRAAGRSATQLEGQASASQQDGGIAPPPAQPAGRSAPSPPGLPSVAGILAALVRAASWILLAGAAVLAIWYLREIWRPWVRRPKGDRGEAPGESAVLTEPPLRFAHYTNPFVSGTAASMAPREVVRYTFAALEAWGRERGAGRDVGQTPQEFTQRLAQRWKPLAAAVSHLGHLYNQAAYSPGSLSARDLKPLERLWNDLQRR